MKRSRPHSIPSYLHFFISKASSFLHQPRRGDFIEKRVICKNKSRVFLVHRGNPNPNRLRFAWGGAGGDWVFPPANLSEADNCQPQAGHQKGENPVRILSFLVREKGLEPSRLWLDTGTSSLPVYLFQHSRLSSESNYIIIFSFVKNYFPSAFCYFRATGEAVRGACPPFVYSSRAKAAAVSTSTAISDHEP